MPDISNPYASSQVADARQAVVAVTDRPACFYRSAEPEALIAAFATWMVLALNAWMVTLLAHALVTLKTAQEPDLFDRERAATQAARLLQVTTFNELAAIVAFIAFLIWTYAAFGNVYSLRAANPQFTPGWAVGWFFVPVFNFFKPYQILSDLWKCSDPGRYRGQENAIRMPAPHFLVGWWWWPRLASAITNVYVATLPSQGALDNSGRLIWTSLATTIALDMPSFVCQWLVIRRIQRFQDERIELVRQHGRADDLQKVRSASRWGDAVSDDQRR